MNNAVQTQPLRLTRENTALAIIDIQERLLPAMFEHERVLRAAGQLARGAALFDLPVIVTEQYRKGLGPTVPELASAIPGFAPIEKLAFSACGADGFLAELRGRLISQVVLCGIEAHVCVLQTCLDLLAEGVGVFVVADATSSRTPDNYRLAVERMRQAGAVIISAEMALFELAGEAGTEQFKKLLAIVK